MYNEETKQRFLTSIGEDDPESQYRWLFDTTAQAEAAAGKDICQIRNPLLADILGSLFGSSQYYLSRQTDRIRKYVEWCHANGVPDVSDDVFQTNEKDSSVGLSKLKKNMLSGPKHLQAVLDAVCASEYDETVDNAYRCYCWLAFSGVLEDDLLRIKTSEVDMRKMVIRHNGRFYPVYRESLPAMMVCVKNNAFVYQHPLYQTKEPIVRERAPGDALIRTAGNTNVMQYRAIITRMVSKAAKRGEDPVRLSYARLRSSGIFYRAFENEKLGVPVSFLPAATDEAIRIYEEKTGKSLPINESTPKKLYEHLDGDEREEFRRQLRRFARAYSGEYVRWKALFYPEFEK